jgi:hypothetical protein
MLSFFLLLGSVPLQVLIGIEKIYTAVPIALLGVKPSCARNFEM